VFFGLDRVLFWMLLFLAAPSLAVLVSSRVVGWTRSGR
jgi:hypothetical protein